jgi:GTP cyclohydrolase I
MSILSESIKNRIKQDGGSFFANDNISKYLQGNEIDIIQSEVEEKITQVLEALIIDIENDHNTKETAKRVARMYIKEVFSGRYVEPPKITEFPNAKQLDEIYTIGPITIRSACSHHLVPITGRAWIGILPSNRVIGISKFVRLVNWIMARPQIQEEATVQLADIIDKLITPRGLAVVIEAKHLCMTWRGVKESETVMTSSVMRGVFRDKPEARAEFLRLIK